MAVNVVSQVSGVLLQSLDRKHGHGRRHLFKSLLLSIEQQQLVAAGGTLVLTVFQQASRVCVFGSPSIYKGSTSEQPPVGLGDLEYLRCWHQLALELLCRPRCHDFLAPDSR